MDQAILVEQAQALVKRLDATRASPRAAMWVHQQDSDTYRLWIVPPAAITDKREFYRIVAETISVHSPEMKGLDVGTTEFVSADHPAMVGMAGFIRMNGIGSATFKANRFNGFFLPDGILIRMAL